MDLDLFDRFWNIADAILSNITGSIWLIFIVFAALSKLFKSRTKVAPEARPTSTIPYSGDSYRPRPAPNVSQSPAAATKTRKRNVPEPSIWARQPSDDEALNWGSPFERESGKTKWGFDDTEWGSEFDRKKQSNEPKISVQ